MAAYWGQGWDRLSDPREDQEFPAFQHSGGRTRSAASGATDSHKPEQERTPHGVQENCVNPGILLCKSLACLQSPHSSSLRSQITALAEIPCSSHAGADRQETEKQNRKTEEDNAQNREQKAVSWPSQRLLRARLPCDQLKEHPSPSPAPLHLSHLLPLLSSNLGSQRVKIHSDLPQFPDFTDENQRQKGGLSVPVQVR